MADRSMALRPTPHRVDDDSMGMAVDEALVFVMVHGWTFADAIELTGACPTLVREKRRKNNRLPTPEMIRQQCEAIRGGGPRMRLGELRTPKESSVREYAAFGDSDGISFESF